MSMKTIMRGLVVACCAALGLNAWAAPTPDIVIESFTDEMTVTGASGAVYTFALGEGNTIADGVVTIGSDAVAGMKITADKALNNKMTVIAKYSNLVMPSDTNKEVISIFSTSDVQCVGARFRGNNTSDLVALSENGNKSSNFFFSSGGGGADNSSPDPTESGYIMLSYQCDGGTACYAGSSLESLTGGYLTGLKYSNRSIWGCAVGGPYTDSAFPVCAGLKIEKVAIFLGQYHTGTAVTAYSDFVWPSEVTVYTCTVDGETASWDVELPAKIAASDKIVFTGSGTVTLPAGHAGDRIEIGEGVVLNVMESGLAKSKVTNNGTIKVTGGEKSSPIVITEDQGADTTIGTIQIAANSCLKIDATGAGNKKYTVTGDSATTSTLILASNHDWGLTDGSQVRKAKVIVTHKCWWERTNAFDESVDLEMQDVEMVTCNNAYTVGSINGTGSFSRSGNSTITITQPRGNTIFRGTCAVPLTISANTFALTGTLTGGLTVGEDAAIKIVPASGTCDLPTISADSVGKIILSGQGTVVNIKEQRVAFIVHDGAIAKIEATVAELAAGKITLPVPDDSSSHSLGDVKVVDANGTEVEITDIAEGTEPNTIVLTLQTNAPITESCNLSEKIDGKTGMIVVQGATGEAEAIAITVDCAIPEGLQLSVTGKADFAFSEGSAVSAGTIKLENGAVTTVAGTINNTITLSDGATLITSGEVTFGEGKQIARSANNKNATLTIGAESTLTLAAAGSINTAVALNLYGTLDLGGNTVDFKSNSAEAIYNVYVGASICNGKIHHQGGFNLAVNVLDVESVQDKTVVVSADLQLCDWASQVLTFSKPSDAEVSITGALSGVGALAIRNSNGVGLRVMKNTYSSGTGRALKGDIVVDAGATLNVTVGDGFEYENNKANLDVSGTINLNANRQTLSSSTQSWGAGAIKLHNGAQIIGAGASHKQTTVGLDIWNATTIEVDGTVTISTPIYGEAARSSVSFVKAEGAETAVVNMTGLNTLNGGFKVGEGVVVDCGTDKATKYAVTLEGGTLKWAGAGNAHGSLVKSVTLTANSRIESTNVGGFVGVGVGGSDESTIDLAGHKLTMKAAQASDRVYFDKTSITSEGTLEIEQGIMFVHCKHLATVADVDLVIGANAMVQNAGDASFDGDRSMTVRNLTYNGTAPTAEHLKLIVTGTLSGTGTIGQLELANGATISVAAVPESGVVASATNALTINDISTIKLAIGGTETTDYTLAIGEDAKSVVATKKATRPKVIEGGSDDQKAAYDEWAKEAGDLSKLTEAQIVDRFIFNVGADATEEDLKDALDEVIEKTNIFANFMAVIAEGRNPKSFEFQLGAYPNATFKFVEVPETEITTSAKLFRLKAMFLTANSEE